MGSNPTPSASMLFVQRRLGKPFRSEGCTPKPIGRRRAALHASYDSAGHPAIISGKTAARPTRFSLPTKISKTTPCKVTGGSLARMLYPRKHFDTSGKSAAPFHHRAICKTTHGAAHRNCGASALNPFGFGDSALVSGFPVRTASASRLSVTAIPMSPQFLGTRRGHIFLRTKCGDPGRASPPARGLLGLAVKGPYILGTQTRQVADGSVAT